MAKVERIDSRPPTLGQGTPTQESVQRRRDVVRRFRDLPPLTRHVGAPVQTFVRNLPVVGKDLSNMMNEGDEIAIEGYRAENPIASFGARAAGHALPYVAGGPATVGGRMAFGAGIEGADAMSEGEDPLIGAVIGAFGGALASAPGRAVTPRNPQAIAAERARVEARRNEMTDQSMDVITGRRNDVPGILSGYEPFLHQTRRTYQQDLEGRVRSAGDRLIQAAQQDPRYMWELRQHLGRVDPSQPNYGHALDEARVAFENSRIRSQVNRRQVTQEFNDRLRSGIYEGMPRRLNREMRARNWSPENIPAWARTLGGYGAAAAIGAHPAAGVAAGLAAGPISRRGRQAVNRVINSRGYDKWINNQVLSPEMQRILYGSLMGAGTAAGGTPEELAPGVRPFDAIMSQLKGPQ